MSRFKIGSMVVGHTIYRPEKTLIGEIVGIDKERPVIHVEEGDGYYIEDFVIKCVRESRKGGKEARDIVAKLTWLYLAQLKKCKNQQKPVYELWKRRYGTLAYQEWALSYKTLSTLYTARETAKSMLKEDLWH